MDYTDFLKEKLLITPDTGMAEIPKLNKQLFLFQKVLVEWALRKGRAALFCDCGLGKTPMQLEWAKHIPGRVLILAPLAVAQQTVREGKKFGIPCEYARQQDGSDAKIVIANYEMLEHFDQTAFDGVVLDESSILKAFDGKTRTRIIETFCKTRYRLACTATPAPNDYMELGNHSEFLGIMSRVEMLSMFFVHDGGDTQKWRLKGHAQKDFWRWICSWAVMLSKPSDLGFKDDGFELPELRFHQIVVDDSRKMEGYLFPMEARSLQERLQARRATVSDRVKACSDVVNQQKGAALVWCNLNDESKALVKAIPDAREVTGSDKSSDKERAMIGFTQGYPRILVSKPSICGYGMNFQNCSKMFFVGLNDSWEQFYQAIRRCWRFGQKEPVDVWIISSKTEGAVRRNIQKKENAAKELVDNMVKEMAEMSKKELNGTKKETAKYREEEKKESDWEMCLGDCVEYTAKLQDNSIHYSIFSPPFASLYTYSNSERDMGNCKTHQEFYDHFKFLVKGLFRATMPGRLVSFHCMNLPTSKVNNGYIGISDFRGDLIRLFQEQGFIYHSEVVIWKDPVTAMQRTKALGLLHKQLKKDSCMSRQGIPDYLVTMRKPGDNPERVKHTNETFPVQVWQKYASPIWMDINPSDTLQYRSAREHNDERHICPLQLGVIRRGIELWSNPGDTVFSPFAGIGSEGFVAIQMGRKYKGVELKESYYKQAVANLTAAKRETYDLFSMVSATRAETKENETWPIEAGECDGSAR